MSLKTTWLEKIEIHGNENSLIAISNKYSVNFA